MSQSENRSDALAGRALGDFVLREKLGEGGFGSVYRADQPRLQREAVVKVLRARHDGNPEVRQRFVREARLAGRFDHPFAAHVYDSNAESDGTLWIAMELVRGVPLDAWLRERGALPPERFAPFFRKVCEVVQSAHERGILHRDLKPANVMAVEEAGQLFPKLLDFGLARLQGEAAELVDAPVEPLPLPLIEPSGDLPAGPISFGSAPAAPIFEQVALITPHEREDDAGQPTDGSPGTASIWQGSRAGIAVGTPAYMAPELWDEKPESGRSADLYALALLAWESLVGRRPFSGDTEALAHAHRVERVPPLPEGLPAGLNAFFAKALAKRPEDRFPSAAELSRAFDEAALQQRPDARRGSRIAAAAAAVLVALAALAGWQWRRHTLPGALRAVALETAPVKDPAMAWLALATQRLAARELKVRSNRFRTVSDASAANVSLRLSVASDGVAVVASAALGRAGGALRELAPARAESLDAALGKALDAVAAALDEGQPDRAPEADESARMARLGARSLAALHAYDRALAAGLGSVYNDSVLAERLAASLVRDDPSWAHAQVLLALVGLDGRAEKQTRLREALQRLDPGRDPAGELLLRSMLAPSTAASFQLLAQGAAAHKDDFLLLWMLGSDARGARNEAVALESWRTAFELRPELQTGQDVANMLAVSGRAAEGREFVRAWVARAPESEQAQLTWAGTAAADGKFDEVETAIRRALLVHGELPHRLVPICRLYLQSGNVAEAGRLAEKLLRGAALERNYGHFFSGVTEVLRGRLNAAEQSFQAAFALGMNQGVVGNGNQSLEELRSLATVLGDKPELRRIDNERAAHFARLGLRDREAFVRFELALEQRPGGACPDIEKSLAGLPEGATRTTQRLLLVRASAAAGCAPCAEAVRLGISPSEMMQRSLFQLGACAEAEGNLQLAADVYQRLDWSGVGSGIFGATAHAVLARLRLGRVLRKQGKPAEARAAYQAFLSLWGSTDRPVAEAAEARAALAQLADGAH